MESKSSKYCNEGSPNQYSTIEIETHDKRKVGRCSPSKEAQPDARAAVMPESGEMHVSAPEEISPERPLLHVR